MTVEDAAAEWNFEAEVASGVHRVVAAGRSSWFVPGADAGDAAGEWPDPVPAPGWARDAAGDRVDGVLVGRMAGGMLIDGLRRQDGLDAGQTVGVLLECLAAGADAPDPPEGETRMHRGAFALDSAGLIRIIPCTARSLGEVSPGYELGEIGYLCLTGALWAERGIPVREAVGDSASGLADVLVELLESRGTGRALPRDLAARLSEVCRPAPVPFLPSEAEVPPGDALTAQLRLDAGYLRRLDDERRDRGTTDPGTDGGPLGGSHGATHAGGESHTDGESPAGPGIDDGEGPSRRTRGPRAGATGDAVRRLRGAAGGAATRAADPDADAPASAGSSTRGTAALRTAAVQGEAVRARHRRSLGLRVRALLPGRRTTGRRGVLVACGAMLSVLAVIAGMVLVVRSSTTGAADTVAADAGPAGGPTDGPAGAPPMSSGPAGSAESSVPGPAGSSDIIDDRDPSGTEPTESAAADPAGAFVELSRRRAQAYARADSALLRSLTVPDSPAARADARAGIDGFAGAEVTIDVEVESDPELSPADDASARPASASLIASMVTRVQEPGGEVREFPEQRIEVELHLIEGVWRVYAVREAGRR